MRDGKATGRVVYAQEREGRDGGLRIEIRGGGMDKEEEQ